MENQNNLMTYSLRPYQEKCLSDCIQYIEDKNNHKKVIVIQPVGCHEKGYRVLMYNGELKNVEDVLVGDKLMGIDSTPRTVLNLCRGKGKMYKITLRNKISFVVNEDHVLKLYRSAADYIAQGRPDKEKGYPKEVEIKVKDYIKWAKSRKAEYKLRRTKGINISYEKPLKLDPYYLGVWLGDGTTMQTSVTNLDTPVRDYLKSYAEQLGLRFVINKYDNKMVAICKQKRGVGRHNSLKDIMFEYDLIGNKHVPNDFLYNTKENQLKLLAGIIDTDGYYDPKQGRYEVSFKLKHLCEQLYYLCGCLGLQPALNIKMGACYNCEDKSLRTYYRVSFRGKEILDDYIKLPRRKFNNYQFQSKEGNMYAFKVEEAGYDDFYGFNLDGDNLYIDENFIIQHNSGKGLQIAAVANSVKEPVIVLQSNRDLLKQNYQKYLSYGNPASIYSASLGIKCFG